MGGGAVPKKREGGPWRRPLPRSVCQEVVFDQKASTTPVVRAVAS